MKKRNSPVASEESDADVERQMGQISRRSFLWAGALVAAGWSGWRWLITRGDAESIPWPLRRVLRVNERVARRLFSPGRLAPTFPPAVAGMPRPNGTEGMDDGFDPATWKLRVFGLAGIGVPAAANRTPAAVTTGARALALADIHALPRVEMVTEFKCIEGWSQVVHWAGARFLDFVAAYPPVTHSGAPADPHNRPEDLPEYVSLETPGGGYYVGLDRESALHPQTLLCYEMNGLPLTLEHGAPLRLAIPVKYGVKHIKRIGAIRFTDKRPADFWAEQGYDWYDGH